MQVGPSDPLILGAAAISRELFQGSLSRRQIYRLVQDGWPLIKVRGKLACRASAIRAHIEALERGVRAADADGVSR